MDVITDDGCRLWTSAVPAVPAAPAATSEDTVPTSSPSHGCVLVHGGPGFWDTLAPIADVLSRCGQGPAIRWDQRGSGRSERRGPYALARFIADLDAVRDAYGLDRVAVVGHSWGASLGLQYAFAHPERVSHLIYISGIGLSWDWRRRHGANALARLAPYAAKLAALHALERPMAGQQREADLVRIAVDFPELAAGFAHAQRLLSPYFVSDPAVNPTLNAEMRNLAEADLIERCTALPASLPVLVVDGARDLRPRWSVDSLAAALPNVTRVALEAAGHLPWLDEPDHFAAVIRDFFAAHPGA